MSILVECVPNISEGRDREKIHSIAHSVEQVAGVKLLDIDAGKSTNRTVITFVGPPEAVIEAAFQLIKKAAELIDMRGHTGAHPRMGATDVCPLVPVSGISAEELVPYAERLAERVGQELHIPVYLYEQAAKDARRKNLSYCRKGEYEGLDKLSSEEWKPDYGPASFDARVKRSGATAIGVRDFLVAYNINLNTTSVRRANAIAFDIREAGRVVREGGALTGKIATDSQGEPVRQPGTLKAVKGIGWYIEEYGIAQLSLNLTNISITPVHVAFDEACARAAERGIRVTGSEIVGLVPKRALLDAADYFLRKQQRSLGIAEEEKVKIAVKSLGLDDLQPFDPSKKVIEYLIAEEGEHRLAAMSLSRFADEAASESPAPGGGSVSAYAAAMGAAMAAMVANLSAHKRGWDTRWEYFSDWAVKAERLKVQLLAAVDEDTQAFTKIMDAYGMPKASPEEQRVRQEAIMAATRQAVLVPLQVARVAVEAMDVAEAMAAEGNPNSVSDAAVGALCLRAGVRGAALNVRINLKDFTDAESADAWSREAAALELKAEKKEAAILKALSLRM